LFKYELANYSEIRLDVMNGLKDLV